MMMAQKRQSSRPFPLIETDGWSWLTSADDKQLESPFFGTIKKGHLLKHWCLERMTFHLPRLFKSL
jgi:hypothetical protein